MAIECLFDLTNDTAQPESLYTKIDFPEPPADRPYLYINMVATVDGKIVLGEAGGSAAGVGGPTDQVLFRRLQRTGDATLIGGSTLRASQVIYPPDKPRFVVTRSGDLPLRNRFFTDAPDRAYVLAPTDLPAAQKAAIEAAAQLIEIGNENSELNTTLRPVHEPRGSGSVDLTAAMRLLRNQHHIRRLLCEGGATLNDELIRAGLADELFLTITPKLKGGAHLPTIVTGAGFPPSQFLPLSLLSLYRDGDELYLRYRFGDSPYKAGT